jgi:hypothetical protein
LGPGIYPGSKGREWQASETILQSKKLVQGKRLADSGRLPYNPKVFRIRKSEAALRSTRFPVAVFRGAPEKSGMTMSEEKSE